MLSPIKFVITRFLLGIALIQTRRIIHAIGTHLAACDATYVYHSKATTPDAYEIIPRNLFVQAGSGDVILSLMEERIGSGEYVFVVSKDLTAEQTVTLTFKGMDKVYVVSDTTGELTETALESGKLTGNTSASEGALCLARDIIKFEEENLERMKAYL